jgi:hypothetical protein
MTAVTHRTRKVLIRISTSVYAKESLARIGWFGKEKKSAAPDVNPAGSLF